MVRIRSLIGAAFVGIVVALVVAAPALAGCLSPICEGDLNTAECHQVADNLP